ncbi:acyl-CoA dehydrogenase family protein [Muricauda brasiliensis]|uniref:acyl-CoA dehydrogenase n=1 Tax=Muricauda brasiliensis TaxID=2162892 RepID=UPI000D38DEA2|nr:acyl-CoA dehydrogenase [Muricauda brasiliensis]
MQELSEFDFKKPIFSDEVLQWVAEENLWNLWVPKCYGGLEMSLSDGLKKLRSLAKVDGSLGWTATLCSGANFFVGNLPRQVADDIFIDAERPVCFGGSGGVFGTAEKDGDGYVISGTWKYATGAPYLTHFTLNAKIQENGQDVIQNDGTPMIRSFLLHANQVEIIEDWETMGLKATATHSFKVEEQWVHEKYSFVYNKVHQPHPVFKVHFSLFADLTLWVNYLGMAEHFMEEATILGGSTEDIDQLKVYIGKCDALLSDFATEIERSIKQGHTFSEKYINTVHHEASKSVQLLSQCILSTYPSLGILASTENHVLNQVFRDYFTATQHHIFRKGTTMSRILKDLD